MMIPAGQSTFSCLFSCFVTLWFSVFGAAVTGDDQPSVPLVKLNDLKLPSEFQQHQIAISEDGGSEEILSLQEPSESRPMLAGDWVPEDPRTIDFTQLPVIPGDHVVVSNVRAAGSDPTQVDKKQGGVNQHNYLIFDQGQFWIMWSDGPGVEDRVGQRVKFSTSPDGLTWSKAEFLTPEPPGSGINSEFYGTRTNQGMRWIARGFWKRDNELLALASLDEAAEFFGPSLELHAFRLNTETSLTDSLGVVSRAGLQQ